MVLLTLLLWMLPAKAEDFPSWTRLPADQTAWSVHAGFPWNGVAARHALHTRVAVFIEAETALFRRGEARIGGQFHWFNAGRWNVESSAALGFVHQAQPIPREGPQASVMLRLSRMGKIEPYLSLYDRELLAIRSTKIVSSTGESVQRDLRLLHTRGGTLGMVFPTQKPLMLDFAIQAGPVDSRFAIPAFFTALHWRPER